MNVKHIMMFIFVDDLHLSSLQDGSATEGSGF